MKVGQVGRFPSGERLRVFQVLDKDSFLAIQRSDLRVYQFDFPGHGLADGSRVPLGRVYKVKETKTYQTKGGDEKTIFVLAPDPDAEKADAARRAEERRKKREREERLAREKEEEAKAEARALAKERREERKRARIKAAKEAARLAREKKAREAEAREARKERKRLAAEKAKKEAKEEAERIAQEKARKKAREARRLKEKAEAEEARKAERERLAESLLSLAKRFEEEGEKWEAIIRLKLVIKKYPETKAAAEARKLLGEK
jgi:hypothetical protein